MLYQNLPHCMKVMYSKNWPGISLNLHVVTEQRFSALHLQQMGIIIKDEGKAAFRKHAPYWNMPSY